MKMVFKLWPQESTWNYSILRLTKLCQAIKTASSASTSNLPRSFWSRRNNFIFNSSASPLTFTEAEKLINTAKTISGAISTRTGSGPESLSTDAPGTPRILMKQDLSSLHTRLWSWTKSTQPSKTISIHFWTTTMKSSELNGITKDSKFNWLNSENLTINFILISLPLDTNSIIKRVISIMFRLSCSIPSSANEFKRMLTASPRLRDWLFLKNQ